MGWWEHGPEGHSFVRSSDDDKNLMMWGDGPADIIGGAIRQIKIEFLRDLGRMPSQDEIIAGIKFSTAVLDDLAEQPKDAPHADEDQHKVIVKYGYASTGGDVRVPERQIEAGYKVTEVLRALAVEEEPELEEDLPEPGPVWTAVFMRHRPTERLPFGSYDDALDFLGHNWNGGELVPEGLIFPDGQWMDTGSLRKILASRAEI
jgi:hypothetical protein